MSGRTIDDAVPDPDAKRRRRGRAGTAAPGVMALGGAFLLLVVAPGAATAVPPVVAPLAAGVPAAPSVVFLEDFEGRTDPATAISVTGYTGADGVQYTADPYWLDVTACNGIVSSAGNPRPAGYCLDRPIEWASVGIQADVLGQLLGEATPNQNSAYAVNTTQAAAPQGETLVLATAGSIPATTAGRFYTVSALLAASGATCRGNTGPVYEFALVDGGVETPVTSAPIDVYAAAGTSEVTQSLDGFTRCVIAGTFTGDQPVLAQSGAVGIALRDLVSTGAGGNDSSIDQLRILDVTPAVDVAFSAPQQTVGANVVLTFTVTNTADLAAKDGWAFTAPLPSGLVIPPGAPVGGDCAATAVASSGALTVGGGALPAGTTSCTIEIPVTAQAPGDLMVCGSDLTAVTGLVPGPCASVTFVAAPSPTPTPTPTPTTPAPAPPTPTPTVAPVVPAGPSGPETPQLADSGSDIAQGPIVAALALVGGIALLAAATVVRRRRA